MQKTFRLMAWIALVTSGLCSVLATGCRTENRDAPAAKESAAETAAPELTGPLAPPAVTAPGNTIFRVKAGLDQSYTDSAGNVWLPDQGFEGGDVVERDPDTAMANTPDPGLFRSEHYGMSSFACKIPNGRYTAKLYFAETFDGITGPGQRVFSFNVQGQEFKDFDVWVKAGGPNRAYVETVPVEVTNEVFRIDFIPQIENPEINALEIIPQPQ
jgi:hypothetical protein